MALNLRQYHYDLLYMIADSKFFRLMNTFDHHILRNLREDGIETRPANSNGLWCCALLPTILVTYSLQFKLSLLYNIVTCISIGFLCYCLLFIIFMSVSCLVLKEDIYGGCVASSLVSALLIYGVLGEDLIFSILYSSISIYLFSTSLRKSLTMFPKTFTIGEAMIVIQGIMLMVVMLASRLIYDGGDKSDSEMQFVNGINFTILTSVGIIVTALAILDETKKDLKTLCYILSGAGTFALVVLHIIIGVDCIIRLACYVLLNVKRVQLVAFWFALSILAGFVVTLRTRLAVKASTVTRKVFHILAGIVFMSGIIFDIYLITLAAGFGLALIILAEALRKSNIEPISPGLEAAFSVYSDEKDVGSFAMTPIYLYVGLACPLILVPVHDDYKLELLSGILSIGVGDTAASWFGSKYGFNQWAGGHKTVEGTAFNIITQIATVYALEFSGLLTVKNALLRTIMAATISGVVEAKTDQIDNLILPLITIIAFQFTWFIC